MSESLNQIHHTVFAEILQRSRDAVALYATWELRIELANPAMLNLLGKDISVMGKRFREIMPVEGQVDFMEILEEVFRTGITYKAKAVAIGSPTGQDSVPRLYEVTCQPLVDDSGKVISVLQTCIQLTGDTVADTSQTEVSRALEATRLRLNELNAELAAANEEYQATNEELFMANELLRASGLETSRAYEGLRGSNLELSQLNIALALREKLALELFSEAPVAIGMLSGHDLKIVTANAQLLELWGRDKDVIGQPLLEAIPELAVQAFPAILSDVFLTGVTYHGKGEKVQLEKNGVSQDSYFNFVYKPVKDQQGNVHSIMIVANEVSEQIQAIQLAQENSTRLSLAISAANMGAYDLDLATGKMQCSDRCKLNFGRDLEQEFNFPDLIEAILPQYREMVAERVGESIKNNTVYEAEYECQLPDGNRRWIHASGSPRYDENGNAIRMVGVTLDITDKKVYELRRDDFLSVAAHELKTPITVLKANLQLLERIKSELDHPKAEKLIGSASASMAKVNVLVEDLLNVSKHSGGRLQLQKSWFDIPKMLENTCNHIRISGEIPLILKGETELAVFADEHRIDQVLVNFVNNAVKYGAGSSHIELAVEKLDGFAKISVKDFGPGIPEEQIPHLFERYWQADKSTKNYSGLGLGLSICAEIIERHGGKIGADSVIGSGATFWFMLPL